jgi:3-oxoacyl-[acyl-carrier-protein] synthase III
MNKNYNSELVCLKKNIKKNFIKPTRDMVDRLNNNNKNCNSELVCLKRNMEKNFVKSIRDMVYRLNDSDSDPEEIDSFLMNQYNKNIAEEIYQYYDYERDYQDELNDAFDDTNRSRQLEVVQLKLDRLTDSLNN